MARTRKQIELRKEYGWLTVLSEASKDGHQNAVPPASAELKNRIQNKCRPYMVASLIAQMPCTMCESA